MKATSILTKKQTVRRSPRSSSSTNAGASEEFAVPSEEQAPSNQTNSATSNADAASTSCSPSLDNPSVATQTDPGISYPDQESGSSFQDGWGTWEDIPSCFSQDANTSRAYSA